MCGEKGEIRGDRGAKDLGNIDKEVREREGRKGRCRGGSSCSRNRPPLAGQTEGSFVHGRREEERQDKRRGTVTVIQVVFISCPQKDAAVLR